MKCLQKKNKINEDVSRINVISGLTDKEVEFLDHVAAKQEERFDKNVKWGDQSTYTFSRTTLFFLNKEVETEYLIYCFKKHYASFTLFIFLTVFYFFLSSLISNSDSLSFICIMIIITFAIFICLYFVAFFKIHQISTKKDIIFTAKGFDYFCGCFVSTLALLTSLFIFEITADCLSVLHKKNIPFFVVQHCKSSIAEYYCRRILPNNTFLTIFMTSVVCYPRFFWLYIILPLSFSFVWISGYVYMRTSITDTARTFGFIILFSLLAFLSRYYQEWYDRKGFGLYMTSRYQKQLVTKKQKKMTNYLDHILEPKVRKYLLNSRKFQHFESCTIMVCFLSFSKFEGLKENILDDKLLETDIGKTKENIQQIKINHINNVKERIFRIMKLYSIVKISLTNNMILFFDNVFEADSLHALKMCQFSNALMNEFSEVDQGESGNKIYFQLGIHTGWAIGAPIGGTHIHYAVMGDAYEGALKCAAAAGSNEVVLTEQTAAAAGPSLRYIATGKSIKVFTTDAKESYKSTNTKVSNETFFYEKEYNTVLMTDVIGGSLILDLNTKKCSKYGKRINPLIAGPSMRNAKRYSMKTTEINFLKTLNVSGDETENFVKEADFNPQMLVRLISVALNKTYLNYKMQTNHSELLQPLLFEALSSDDREKSEMLPHISEIEGKDPYKQLMKLTHDLRRVILVGLFEVFADEKWETRFQMNTLKRRRNLSINYAGNMGLIALSLLIDSLLDQSIDNIFDWYEVVKAFIAVSASLIVLIVGIILLNKVGRSDVYMKKCHITSCVLLSLSAMFISCMLPQFIQYGYSRMGSLSIYMYIVLFSHLLPWRRIYSPIFLTCNFICMIAVAFARSCMVRSIVIVQGIIFNVAKMFINEHMERDDRKSFRDDVVLGSTEELLNHEERVRQAMISSIIPRPLLGNSLSPDESTFSTATSEDEFLRPADVIVQPHPNAISMFIRITGLYKVTNEAHKVQKEIQNWSEGFADCTEQLVAIPLALMDEVLREVSNLILDVTRFYLLLTSQRDAEAEELSEDKLLTIAPLTIIRVFAHDIYVSGPLGNQTKHSISGESKPLKGVSPIASICAFYFLWRLSRFLSRRFPGLQLHAWVSDANAISTMTRGSYPSCEFFRASHTNSVKMLTVATEQSSGPTIFVLESVHQRFMQVMTDVRAELFAVNYKRRREEAAQENTAGGVGVTSPASQNANLAHEGALKEVMGLERALLFTPLNIKNPITGSIVKAQCVSFHNLPIAGTAGSISSAGNSIK